METTWTRIGWLRALKQVDPKVLRMMKLSKRYRDDPELNQVLGED